MLNKSDISKNKAKYLDLLKTVKREGIMELAEYLENKTDFFTAPASTRFHGSYEGGLCEHSLGVYHNLVTLNEAFHVGISEDSLKITALLHDLSKCLFYEKYLKNVKVDGQWVQEEHYKVRDRAQRFIYASHEQTSLFIAQQFIPITIEEQVSILSHHGGVDKNGLQTDIVSDIYATYELPKYLHFADLIDANQKYE